jgi:transcription-repair coupling factor (superfamily II helicase)
MLKRVMNFIEKALAAADNDNEFLQSKLTFENAGFPFSIKGLRGSFLAFFIKSLKSCPPVTLVVPTEADARLLAGDFETFGIKTQIFPSQSGRLYQSSPVSGERQSALLKIAAGVPVTLIPLRDFLRYTAPPAYACTLSFTLRKGEELAPEQLAKKLTTFGYLRVPRVGIPGEYALRGEVIDIFVHGEEEAFRIQTDYDVIDELKSFDVENQMSLNTFDTLTIPAAREALYTADEIKALAERWNKRHDFKGLTLPTDDLAGAGRYQEIFLPLLFENPASVIDYLPDTGVLLLTDYEKLENAAEAFLTEAEELYKQAIRSGMAVPKPEELIAPFHELAARKEQRVELKNFIKTNERHLTIHYEGPRSFFGNINFLKEELTGFSKNHYTILIFAENEQQALRIETLLKDFDVTVIPCGLSGGFCLPQARLIAICEHEIFGRKKREKGVAKKRAGRAIDSFVELNVGDYVVHVNHGVGLFKGIERLKAAGSERDYIVLQYAGDDTVFIPIEQVNLVQRYIGSSGETPKLDIIGSKSWINRKNKAAKSAEELAGYLLDVYARREETKGFAYPPDDDFQLEFEADFPYQETPDQLETMREIKADMEKERPMDRLVCGDVGYGKTELAMRAAFKAVMAGKQAAILCPTTILAEQHYKNFIERFKRFGFVRFALLSRFVDKKRQHTALKEIAEGKIDIIIGTHRILSKDVVFRNLGLLVVDEEQRFGVKDKEKIKAIKTAVDCLALSATPIPRTLYMSLVKIRDLSTLKTPPANRHPVETIVDEYNTASVAHAIRRELERGGQVFYLHNRVDSLEATRTFLAELVPEAFIEMAHGKMQADEIDDIMYRFISGAFQVLVSTTIIESGIDIPNVNTIIIDRADMYGVSQLYQLRGRVGRSDRIAYAYLFYPEQSALSELAMKRLQIISDFTELGSGFKIAMKDMEVRGAGNLLGREQSGQIHAVGFDLYLRMLDDAIKEKTHDKEDNTETFLELEYSGFIPDSYISDTMEKMEVYKKIAGIMTEEELAQLYMEINDRFGPIPDEVHSLFSLAEIKILGRKLKIKSIREHKNRVQIIFAKFSAISVDNVMRLIRESNGKIKPDPSNPAALLFEVGKINLKEKSEFIRDYLARL